MNISSPTAEVTKFMDTMNKSEDTTKILNATLRVASYAAMFFAAAATVVGALAIGIACPAAGAAALLIGAAVTVLMYDTYQTSKAFDETLGADGLKGMGTRFGKMSTDWIYGKGNSTLIWTEALTQNTLLFKHVTSLASAIASAA